MRWMSNNIDYLVNKVVLIERQSINQNFEAIDNWHNSKASKGKGDAKVVGEIIQLIKGEDTYDNQIN